MSPWLAFLVTLSLIILVHELGHFFMARAVGVKVERFSLGFGPRLLRFTRGGTEYALSLFPIGGYVKMAGESPEGASNHPWEYQARPVRERIGIVLAGPLINYALGFLLFAAIFAAGAPFVTAQIGKVLEEYPAAQAGLKGGDRILSVEGKPVESWEEVTEAIRRQTQSVSLTIQRGEESFTQVLQPKVKETTNLLGLKVRVGMIGILPSDEVRIRRYPLPVALWKAGERVWILTSMTLQALWRMATGGLSIRESVTGPIGIFFITSSVAEQGLLSLLQLIAVLSTSLGLFNLLPIPVLDGGHIAFLVLEGIQGRPVSARTQEVMTRLGLGLLTLLLLVVTYNDILRFKIIDHFLPFLGRE
ncbi:MAG: RIP metalloprotease RseP [Candidatus Omnitrophica bacterium]|nr:RIP metalloprotease RseP [Candidatus Omnitrophota bacterium]